MARRKRIAVTGSSKRVTPSWWCISLALRLVGAKPYRISVRHNSISLDEVDGLIISGGEDISPEHYSGDDLPQAHVDPARDELEIKWIQEALEKQTPLLGICRGAQLINAVLGGTLIQDLRNLRQLTYNRPGLLPTKQVFLERGSSLREIAGKGKIRVNSLHHQAIDKPGSGLKVVGKDLDGIVQAVEKNSEGPIVGVQWHPEYLFYLPSQLRLFRWLCEACK